MPEILGKAQMNQGERQSRCPIGEEMTNRHPPPEYLDERADDGPVQEPEHGMVPLMVPDRGMMHIDGQASNEPITAWNGRDLNQGDPASDDQILQESDMHV